MSESTKQITVLFNDPFYTARFRKDLEESDSVTSTESESLSASISTTLDSGTVTETQSLVVEIYSIDYAVGTEVTPRIALSAEPDLATSAETEVIDYGFRDLSDTETAIAVDYEVSMHADVDDFDYGDVFETIVDVGSPDPIELVIVTESQEIAAEISGVESLSVISETHSLEILDLDLALAVETESVEVLVEDSDLAVGTEVEEINASIYSNESANFVEQAAQLNANLASVETVNVAEVEVSQSVSVSSSDSITYIELYESGKIDTDYIFVTESETLVAKFSDSDFAGTTEFQNLAVGGEDVVEMGPYYAQILASNPLHYWRLGEIGSSVAYDKQRRMDGEFVGPHQSVRGIIAGESGAIKFLPGGGVQMDRVDIDYNSFSLEFVGSDLSGGLFTKIDELVVSAASDEVTFTIYNSDGVFAHQVTAPATTGHFALAVNNGVARAYLDGLLVDESPRIGDTRESISGFTIATDMTGILDEVAIYSRGLMPDEIFRHYYAAILNEPYVEIVKSLRPLLHATLAGTIEEDSEYYEADLDLGTGTFETIDGPKKFFVLRDLASRLTGSAITYPVGDVFSTLEQYAFGFSLRQSASGVVAQLGDWNISTGADGRIVYTNGTESYSSLATSMLNGEWHNIVISYGGDSLDIFIDGVLDRSLPASPAPLGSGTLQLGSAATTMDLSDFFITELTIDAAMALTMHKSIYDGRSDHATVEVERVTLEDDGFKLFVYDNVISEF